MTILRVADGYAVFSHTVDEPAHLTAGTLFLTEGRPPTGDIKHQPVARLAVALGPYLLGEGAEGACRVDREERLMQCKGQRYWRTLTAARLGTLPFLALLLAVVWVWAGWAFGPLAGALACLLVAHAPPVLAHGGLATTDVAATATFALALFMLVLWCDRPSTGRALAVGCTAGLACTTKLSAVAFLPAAALAIAGVLWATRALPRVTLWRLPRHLGWAAAAFLLTAWTAYGFSLSAIAPTDGSGLLGREIYPLGQLARGIWALLQLKAAGHSTYFMGEIAAHGWRSFFPTMFAAKTPIAMLLLIALSAVYASRGSATARIGLPLAAASAVLIVAMMSNLAFGLRHVLALYPLAGISAGAATAAILRLRSGAPALKGLVVVLLLWLVVDVARWHPDYLPYFNEATRHSASYFATGSDLDWGQDAKRLADEIDRREIARISVAVNSTLKIGELVPATVDELWPGQRVSGWAAVGIARILHDRIKPPYTGLRWLACRAPVAQIGSTILLYQLGAEGVAVETAGSCSPPTLALPP